MIARAILTDRRRFATHPGFWLAAAACYFLVLAGDGLNGYFTADDGMNLGMMHGYWGTPLARIAAATLWPFGGTYRPVGGFFYHVMFGAAGFNPLPFRAVCFVLLLLNLALAYALARRLCGSRAAALLASFVCAYHAGLADLYYNTATVYDLLCFTFYYSALLCYVRGARLVWVLLLYAFALNSKEMAVTLPLMILIFEALYNRPVRWQGFAATFAITAVFVAAKLLTRNPISTNVIYQLRWSPSVFFEAMRHYHDTLFYQERFFTPTMLVLLWTLMGAAALVARSRAMGFSALLALSGMLPVCFISPPRAGFVLYLPLAGWAAYVAAATRGRVWVCGLVAGALFPVHLWARRHVAEPVRQAHARTRNFMEQLTAIRPTLPPGACLLFTSDPFPPDDWTALFLARLYYRDPRIWVDRRPDLSPQEKTLYDRVFAYRQGRLEEVPAESAEPGPLIRIEFTPKRVRPREPYTVKAPELAGQTVDVLADFSRGPAAFSQLVRKWLTLDALGCATVVTPPDHASGRVSIRKIRAQNQRWRDARGEVEVLP